MESNVKECEFQLAFDFMNQLQPIHIETKEEPEPIEDTEDDICFEQMYTREEEESVIWELNRGLNLKEINKNISKRKLKNWFADLCIKYRGEAYADITGQDLCDIAKKIGFNLEG